MKTLLYFIYQPLILIGLHIKNQLIRGSRYDQTTGAITGCVAE